MVFKKAVIVAAGKSSRLYPLTKTTPKGLLEINGRSLLTRSVDALRERGVDEIAVVVGYLSDSITRAMGGMVESITNPFYAQCNNMGSLWFARDFIGGEPFIYLHSDLLYDPQILDIGLDQMKASDCDMNLLTDYGPVDEEAMKVRVTETNHLICSSKEIPLDEGQGEWTGIAFIRKSKDMFDAVEKWMMAGKLNDYDTAAFSEMAASGSRILCGDITGNAWIEIDTHEDLAAAQRLPLCR